MTTPIAIDCGSHSLRAGYCGTIVPAVNVRSISAHPRKSRLRQGHVLAPFVGIEATEADSANYVTRTPFENNVAIQYESMEALYDHTFNALGIRDASVSNPLVISECPHNPSFTRVRNAELLFEGYGATSLCFGVDALLSYWNEAYLKPNSDNGLVVSLGDHTTHVIPVLSGHMAHGSLRIPLGGQSMADFLCRVMELDFPHFKGVMSPEWARDLIHKYAYVPPNYMDELRRIADDTAFAEAQAVEVMIAPIQPEVMGNGDGKRKRQAQGMRLAEKAEEKRQKEARERDERLILLESVVAKRGQMYGVDLQDLLMSADVKSMADADTQISLLREQQAKSREREIKRGERRAYEQERKRIRPLVAQVVLDAEQRGYGAKADHDLVVSLSKQHRIGVDVIEREASMVIGHRANHVTIMNRRKERVEKTEREKSRTTYKGKKLATLTRAAFDLGDGERSFGVNDNDWDMYRDIGDSALQEMIEEENEELGRIRRMVVDEYEMTLPQLEEEEEQVGTHVSLCVSRIQCPEMLFQPYIVGESCCGVSEAIGHVLNRIRNDDIRAAAASNVFLSGGVSSIKGLSERISQDLRSIRPVDVVPAPHVWMSTQPSLSAWCGAASYAQILSKWGKHLSDASVSRAVWNEEGPRCLDAKHMPIHPAGNPRL